MIMIIIIPILFPSFSNGVPKKAVTETDAIIPYFFYSTELIWLALMLSALAS